MNERQTMKDQQIFKDLERNNDYIKALTAVFDFPKEKEQNRQRSRYKKR